jgi:hypothetical protein
MIELGILFQSVLFCYIQLKDLPLSRSDKFATITLWSILIFSSSYILYSQIIDFQQTLLKHYTTSAVQIANLISLYFSGFISTQILNHKIPKSSDPHVQSLKNIFIKMVPGFILTMTLYLIISLVIIFLLPH